MSHKSPSTEPELLDAFLALFNETEPNSQQEIIEVLEEEGLRPKDVGVRMAAVARRAQERSPLNWRSRSAALAHEQAQLARHGQQPSRPDLLHSIQERLALVAAGQRPQLMAAYRNLETLTDEDLVTLIQQLELLS